MAEHDWNEQYASGEPLPWDTGVPERLLVDAWKSGRLPGKRVLDVGCGTGTNSLWLAQQGCDVLGVDISAAAVEKARQRAGKACRFAVVDFLKDDVPGGPFDLVFDRGCFHVFDAAADRSAFAARVARVLAPRGRWLSLIGSTEGAPRDFGPPRRTLRDIASAIEPSLRVIELREGSFSLDGDGDPVAWFCLSEQREQPAQPSSD
jgi:SAM-dependent methyltransferase